LLLFGLRGLEANRDAPLSFSVLPKSDANDLVDNRLDRADGDAVDLDDAASNFDLDLLVIVFCDEVVAVVVCLDQQPELLCDGKVNEVPVVLVKRVSNKSDNGALGDQ